jgi:NAD(P)-dependent dehydrogenase (short-subunit alcohol dehydrogenase family)
MQGKRVVITGGTSGIGRAAAFEFASRGAKVVVIGRSSERGERFLIEARERNLDLRFFAGDVSREEEVERLFAIVASELGGIDAGVNAAGALERGSFLPTHDTTSEDYDHAMTLNLKSLWLSMRAEIRMLLGQSTGGSIVNVSSVNGLGGVPNNALYAAAKAATLAFTKSAALEYASAGIRVNALVAGAFRTPMLESVIEKIAGAEHAAAAESQYAAMIPLGRIGKAEEAAAAIVWLSSDEASYVTGQSMIVDGGLTAPYR